MKPVSKPAAFNHCPLRCIAGGGLTLLDYRVGRFDADPAMVNAWERLKKGDYIKSDIDLLRHEYFESRFEGIFSTIYRVAHDAAERSGRVWNSGG
ncbi:hypothetical protein AL507_07450 [Providencia stuartii]|nr:hypothetical protein AL507_07450 [Providencia stuartii]